MCVRELACLCVTGVCVSVVIGVCACVGMCVFDRCVCDCVHM